MFDSLKLTDLQIPSGRNVRLLWSKRIRCRQVRLNSAKWIKHGWPPVDQAVYATLLSSFRENLFNIDNDKLVKSIKDMDKSG